MREKGGVLGCQLSYFKKGRRRGCFVLRQSLTMQPKLSWSSQQLGWPQTQAKPVSVSPVLIRQVHTNTLYSKIPILVLRIIIHRLNLIKAFPETLKEKKLPITSPKNHWNKICVSPKGLLKGSRSFFQIQIIRSIPDRLSCRSSESISSVDSTDSTRSMFENHGLGGQPRRMEFQFPIHGILCSHLIPSCILFVCFT